MHAGFKFLKTWDVTDLGNRGNGGGAMDEKGEKEANDSLKSIRLVKFGDEISSITLTNRLSNPH
jgi:hypothetical protein